MKPYTSINKDLLEIGGKIYKIVRYLGDMWFLKECNTFNFYIFDRSEDYCALILKKSSVPTFIFTDLLDMGFVDESTHFFFGHIFKLVRCKENQCLYVVDLDLEVKHFLRVPSEKGEVFFHPKNGDIVGVFYEALNVVHIEDGKFVQ